MVIVEDVVTDDAAGNAVSEVNVETLDHTELRKFSSVNTLGTIDSMLWWLLVQGLIRNGHSKLFEGMRYFWSELVSLLKMASEFIRF